ncbi:hypothetical protein FRB98_007574 [Tulasnella sp. 332]|nr:hypothetical protein FRB98_007574 [Tulasnella sp. 332]
MSSRRNSGSGPAPSRVERISFNGAEGEDVTEFIREVNRIAIDHGKRRDQEWMVDYAEACLGGGAMRWHDGLEEDVQASWKGLRRALLNRFSPPDNKHVPPAAPAANIPSAATNASSRIVDIETAIDGLKASVGQLEEALARSTADVKQQIDATTELKEGQVDLRNRIAKLETHLKDQNEIAQVSATLSNMTMGTGSLTRELRHLLQFEHTASTAPGMLPHEGASQWGDGMEAGRRRAIVRSSSANDLPSYHLSFYFTQDFHRNYFMSIKCSSGSGPPSRAEHISFSGADGEDLTEFIREVNRVVIDHWETKRRRMDGRLRRGLLVWQRNTIA